MEEGKPVSGLGARSAKTTRLTEQSVACVMDYSKSLTSCTAIEK